MDRPWGQDFSDEQKERLVDIAQYAYVASGGHFGLDDLIAAMNRIQAQQIEHLGIEIELQERHAH